MIALQEHEGPEYPRQLGATVAAFRRKTKRGLRDLSADERQAYGAAVEQAILKLQRTEFMRASVVAMPQPHCASGTWHTTGEEIAAAIRQRQRNALLNCPAQERRARTPDEWRSMYEAAMADRAARRSQAAKRAWVTRRKKHDDNQRRRPVSKRVLNHLRTARSGR
jgi:hypothetical protein